MSLLWNLETRSDILFNIGRFCSFAHSITIIMLAEKIIIAKKEAAGSKRPISKPACAAILIVLDLLGAASSAPSYPYPTQIDGSWPGGGFPAQPSGWLPSLSLRASTANFFLGNNTGPNSETETGRECGLGTVGLSWALGMYNGTRTNFVGANGSLEERQRVAASAIKKQCGNATKVMLSADIDCTAGFWSVSKAAMANISEANELFLRWPNGSLFLDWWGETRAAWYNFSSPVAVDWWIKHGPIAEALKDENVDVSSAIGPSIQLLMSPTAGGVP